jgi:hypothetical protein
MLYHLERKILNRRRITSQVGLLTVHDYTHILDETVDDLERLSCRSSSFILRESVEPLQDCLDVLVSETSLYKSDCVAMSTATRQ